MYPLRESEVALDPPLSLFGVFLWLSRFLKFSRAREVSADNMVPWIEEYPVDTFGMFFLLVNSVQQKYSLIIKFLFTSFKKNRWDILLCFRLWKSSISRIFSGVPS